MATEIYISNLQFLDKGALVTFTLSTDALSDLPKKLEIEVTNEEVVKNQRDINDANSYRYIASKKLSNFAIDFAKATDVIKLLNYEDKDVIQGRIENKTEADNLSAVNE